MNEQDADGQTKAIARFKVISAYLALEPDRGRRRATLDMLAAKVWTDADGKELVVAAETIRVWVRRYRKHGLAGLADKARPRRGVRVLPPTLVELACNLKREVPERSLDRLLRILVDTGQVEPGIVTRSTLHRVLQGAQLSARKARIPDSEDLDRFEAAAPNDLWQSDMLVGPWLPDPEKPGHMRRAYLSRSSTTTAASSCTVAGASRAICLHSSSSSAGPCRSTGFRSGCTTTTALPIGPATWNRSWPRSASTASSSPAPTDRWATGRSRRSTG